MADYRIKAHKTGPRSFLKELQMISYRGSALYTEAGSPLIADKKVYYPPDYLASGAHSVVLDPESFREFGLSKLNKEDKGRPASLGIVEQFSDQSEVSRSLLGIDRAETQQGLFGNVSSYGLDKKDWVTYSGYPDHHQGANWEFKNSPSGRHNPTREYDYASGSAVVIDSYPVPFYNPGNDPTDRALRGDFGGPAGVRWTKYLQGLVAMYIIEHMVNNFTPAEKTKFQLEYIEGNYPKDDSGNFNRLYWDRIWSDIDQSRVGGEGNIPIIPKGKFKNFGNVNAANSVFTNLKDPVYEGGASTLPAEEVGNMDLYFGNFFWSSTRYEWTEPDKGHYRIKTNASYRTEIVDGEEVKVRVWDEYWGMDYDLLPQDLKDWEFRVLESEPGPDSPEVKYTLPYYLITDKVNAPESLLFGESWPKTFSDEDIPQIPITDKLTEGNAIGFRESRYAVQTLTSVRAFRYQPGRISGFTYGVRVSEEGAGPGTILEFGVENYSDGYFFRLKDGTDFSIVRRSTVPLGETDLFTEAGYQEREVFVNRLTGVAKYKDTMSQTERDAATEDARLGNSYLVFETAIEQNQMNGDGLNNRGPSGYIYNPDTVTMYKIEFGWYGAIGARFYAYIPQDKGEARWVTLHTLVIENQIGEPCLEDPYFFFKYRVFNGAPNAIRLPQFVEKYGASYYIDGGDEGTVQVGSGSATNRPILDAGLSDYSSSTSFPVHKWSTVLGIKPKKKIINSEGNEFFNKKEIYPSSISVFSNKNVELKFVNQFGCQEHAFTFQEGFRCNIPESQRLRGRFEIISLETNEDNLSEIGKSEAPCPTIRYTGPVDQTTYPDSWQNLGGSTFVGWDGLERGLLGTKLVARKVYQAYANPGKNINFINPSKTKTTISRNVRDTLFEGRADEGQFSSSGLLFRYPQPIDIKLSPYRKDTTIVSTVDLNTEEFYILFTSQGTGSGNYDTYEDAQVGPNFDTVCPDNGGGRCDARNVSDMQIAVIWPTEDNSVAGTDAASYTYPKSHIHKNAVGPNFGILAPQSNDTVNTSARAKSSAHWSGKKVELLQNDSNDYYVKDKQIPNVTNDYKYFEGLPIDIEDNALKDNRLIVNSTGWVHVSNSLETGEAMGPDSLGEIDEQLPGIPGEDGGECRALFVKAGQITEVGTFQKEIVNGSTKFYLAKGTTWPKGIDGTTGTSLFVENSLETLRTYLTDGSQEVRAVPGTNLKEFWLPVDIGSQGEFADDEEVEIRYRAISIFQPSLLSDTARLLASSNLPADPFPLRVFIRMRDGGEIGSVIIAKKTPLGLINVPFTPHGCTVATNSSLLDHDGGVNDNTHAAKKAIGIFTHPGTLNEGVNFSYFDTNANPPVSKDKKCASFLSRTSLEGTGFSGVGDYPLRFLKFKDSGDPVGAFYISANKPQEISLKEIFNYGGESVYPSFWSNRAMFMIARDIGIQAGDDGLEGFEGTLSVTLNYIEQ